ncbi:MAG: FHA domain-containing protein [Acidimicrobiia bacterium]|nr:FHA domain-containing protein [Acidimicrobiia bacterium]
MSSQLLTVLQLCLLVLVYLFFLRVLRAVWTEIRGPAPRAAVAAASTPAPSAAAPAPRAVTIGSRLLVREPASHAGMAFELADEITVGRAAGCHVTLDDTYVSQIHARVFRRDGQVLVEDLGSTNGTYLNRSRVSAPMVVHPGDHLQIGGVVLELA